MSTTTIDIPAWVNQALPGEREFRQVVHIILTAFAGNKELGRHSFMKGGILLRLHYGSDRATKDMDFSTPREFSPEVAAKTIELLDYGLAAAVESLGYDLDCRVQSHQKDPRSPQATFINLRINVGYARKGSHIHRRLLIKKSPQVVPIDYSFLENVPASEMLRLPDEGVLCVYGLPTLIAEKLRAVVQQELRNRVRRQDIYDLQYLLAKFEPFDPEAKAQILDAIRIKAADRNVDMNKDALRNPIVKERAQREYHTLKDEIEGELPDFDASYEHVMQFYEDLPW